MWKYNGKITAELYVRAQRLHFGKRLWLFLSLLFVLCFILFSWMLRPEMDSSDLLWYLAIACVFPPLFWFLSIRNWRRLYRRSPYFEEPIHAVIGDDGFRFESQHSSGIVPWQRFIALKESQDMLLLYHAPNLFNIVPREFFASEADWVAAKSLAKTKIKSGA